MNRWLRSGASLACLLASTVAFAQNNFTDLFDQADGAAESWSVHNGSWNVSNEVYRCEVPEAWTWAGSPPIELDGDFELSMNVDFPNPPGDVVGRHGGFMFYASGATSRTTTSGYTIDWIDRAADHGFRFIKWNNGRPTETIVNGTPGVAEPPTLWELSVVGDQITFRGDGEEIFSVAHSEFRAGHFGLWSYSNSDMEFDNVEIFTGPSSIRPCFSASPSSGDAPLGRPRARNADQAAPPVIASNRA